MKITSRHISNNAKRLKSLVRRPMLPLYTLEGEYHGSILRALVADDGSSLSYMRSLMYPNGADIRSAGSIASAIAPRLAHQDADIVCVGANQFLLPLYGQHGFRLVPKWVRLYLPITGTPDEMVSALSGDQGGAVRRNVRKMKESGFTHEVTHDIEWLDYFYDHMYLPYSRNRFGELAVCDPQRRLRHDFLEGGGLIVRRNGEQVAAVLFSQRGPTLWFQRVGVLNGDEKYTREGASTALYYYTILHAYESGCTGVDFGHSRPLVSDGPLRYKLKWGMKVLDEDDSIGAFAIATPGNTEVARRFLADNSFYEFTSKGIRLRDDD